MPLRERFPIFQSRTYFDSCSHTDMHGLVAALEDKGVITSCRDDNLRVSSHFYNNLEDVEVLFDALNGLRELLA